MTNRAESAVLRVIDGSVLCRAVARAVRTMRRSRRRMIVGLGGGWSEDRAGQYTQTLNALTAGSRIVGAFSSLLTFFPRGWNGARVRQLVDPLMSANLADNTRAFGVLVVTAVSVHVALSAALGIPSGEIGWTFRAGLLVAGVAMLTRPAPIATAWKARFDPTGKEHRS